MSIIQYLNIYFKYYVYIVDLNSFNNLHEVFVLPIAKQEPYWTQRVLMGFN